MGLQGLHRLRVADLRQDLSPSWPCKMNNSSVPSGDLFKSLKATQVRVKYRQSSQKSSQIVCKQRLY